MSPVTGIVVIIFVCAALPALAWPGVTERASVASKGAEANNSSGPPSAPIAFASIATNLVPGDTNDAIDVFVHDRRPGTTERVSVDGRGREGDGHSGIVGVRGIPAITVPTVASSPSRPMPPISSQRTPLDGRLRA